MTISQIISSDGYINQIHGKKKGMDIMKVQFYFPLVSDYILPECQRSD